MHVHDALHGSHERVAEPLGQFVEGHDAFPGQSVLGEGGAGPGVAEGAVVDCCARGRPDWGKAVDEDGPECWDCYYGDGGGAAGGVGKEVVCPIIPISSVQLSLSMDDRGEGGGV